MLAFISINTQTTGALLKAQIDTDITNKTGSGSISKVNVGGNLKAVVDYVDQQAPKVALIYSTQSGTGNPSLTMISNTTGKTYTADRANTGSYNIYVSPPFSTASKCLVSVFLDGITHSIPQWAIQNFGSSIAIETKAFTSPNFALADGILNGAQIKIEIYN